MIELGLVFFAGLMVGWVVPAPEWATKFWEKFRGQ